MNADMNEDLRPGGSGKQEHEEGAVPETRREEASGHGEGLVPRDQVAAAIRMQAEVLHKLDEKQDRIENAVKDGRRTEMMIASTRALNESFRGMQRVQQGLLERLHRREGRGILAGLLWLLGAGMVAGAVVWGVDHVSGLVQAGRGQEAGLVPGARVRDMEGRLAALREENRGLEGRVKALDERGTELEERLADLRRQRDRALAAEREVLRSKEALRAELDAWKVRAHEAEASAARLTDRLLARDRLMTELSGTLQRLRGAGAASPGEGESGSSGTPERGEQTGNAAPRDPEGSSPLAPGVLQSINELLARHQGDIRCRLCGASGTSDGALTDVVLEVRDGSGDLDRRVEAEELRFRVAGRLDAVTLLFRRGDVTYAMDLGRKLKSPFYKGRYELTLAGIDRRAWLAAGLPCVQVR